MNYASPLLIQCFRGMAVLRGLAVDLCAHEYSGDSVLLVGKRTYKDNIDLLERAQRNTI